MEIKSMEMQIREELNEILAMCTEKSGVPDWRVVGLDTAREEATRISDYFAGADHPSRLPAFIAKHVLKGMQALNVGDREAATKAVKWAKAVMLPHGRQSLRNHLNSCSVSNKTRPER